MRKTLLIILCLAFITCQVNAQDDMQDNGQKEEQHLTYDQMTELMVSELHLDEKQQVKLTKINRRFKNLIEGDHREPPSMGGFGSPQGGEGAERGGHGGGGRMMGGGPMGGGMSMGGHGGGGMSMGGGPMGGHGGGGMMGGGMMGGHGGGHMGGGPMGGPGGGGGPEAYDYDKQQRKYDKAVRKLFNDEQFEGYKKIKTQFYSQRRIKEFLLGH